MKDKRLVNFELLRIVSMLLIILFHVIMHANLTAKTTDSLKTLIEFIYTFTTFHVNSFVLLSGYFQYNKEFKLKKFLSLFNATWFYKIIFALIFIYFGYVKMKGFDVLLFILPINFSYSYGSNYWFINVYLCLYLLSPFINTLIKNLDYNSHKKLCILLFILVSIISTITLKQVVEVNGYNIISFIFLYIVGAFLGKYKNKRAEFIKLNKEKKQVLLLFIFTILVIIDFLVVVSKKEMANYNSVFFNYINSLLNNYNLFSNPFIVIKSIIYFLLFETIEIKGKIISKIISKIAKTTFGVYLVHENLFVFTYMYKYLPFHYHKYLYGYSTIIKLFIITILIFIVSSIIEAIRQLIIKLISKTKLHKYISNKVYNYLDNLIK